MLRYGITPRASTSLLRRPRDGRNVTAATYPPLCCTPLFGGVRHLAWRPTRSLHLLSGDFNPARQPYAMNHAYEEPTFRFISEGNEIDFKAETRDALKKMLPLPRRNFTSYDGPAAQGACQQTVQLFRRLCLTGLVSYAQVRSTPERLAAFYETVATADLALAAMTADHFTAAGFLSTHAHPQAQQHWLRDADSGRSILCIAERELIAEGLPPLNTEARYDAAERCFVLRGAGKFGIVAAEVAEAAIVTATLTLKKNMNHGMHAFVVPLRDRGVLRKGVTIQRIGGEGEFVSRCGAAVIHFEEVRLPVENLMYPFGIALDGEVKYVDGKTGDLPSVEVLRTRTRLATGALYVGTLKRHLTDVVHYVADRDTVGPDSRRNYPYLGLQHVQTPLVCQVAMSFVYLAAWQRILPIFADVSGKEPEYKDHMRLAGIVHFLQESLTHLHTFSCAFLGVHASFASSGVSAVTALVSFRSEGADQTALIREVAFKSITKNIGTAHWGWWLAGLLEALPSLSRFVKNPFYSPRISDLGRHLLFFSHKHYNVKKRLRRSREIERHKGGYTHQWYDWVMFRHREVVHCGEAFMEMHFLETIMAETQRCTDPRGRKVLRDIGWIYALGRQMDRLDYLLSNHMLSPSKAVILASHLDNLVTVLAPQCVNLVDSMQVPKPWRAPIGWSQTELEAYWTIPGTNTHFHRGDCVTLHHEDSGKEGNTKEEQEAMREDPREYDLLHDLADEPRHGKSRTSERV